WDNFDFSDSSIIFNPNYGEQAIVDYIGYFPLVSTNQIDSSVHALFNRVKDDQRSFLYFKEVFDNYLANPNSPMNSDLFYEPVVKYMINAKNLEESERIKYKTLLPLIQKNKPGTVASDFTYMKPDGKTANLQSIKSPFIFLMFYEPGCSQCEHTIASLKDNSAFNSVIDQGGLKVLAIYPDGNKEIWKDYSHNIPSNWINGIDLNQTILTQGIYQIKATPTIYLLDKDKKVILKDTDLKQIGEFFNNL
ncbi:MAG: DUF5106 domain-containing protein, partial [Sphingobacterium sp.]